MIYANHIAQLDELSASEGVFTTAQAARMGVTRNALSRAVASGRAVRLLQGAYRLAGVPSKPTDELAAVWKLTNPTRFTWERMRDWDGIVVGGSSAAALLGIGDLYLSPYRIYAPRRINSRIRCASFGRREIEAADVTWISGLPVTKPARTLVDLALDHEDPSLLENALVDASHGNLDFDRLDTLVSEQTSHRNSVELANLSQSAARHRGIRT